MHKILNYMYRQTEIVLESKKEKNILRVWHCVVVVCVSAARVCAEWVSH